MTRERRRLLERNRYAKNPAKYRAKGLRYYRANREETVIAKRANYKKDPAYDKWNNLRNRSRDRGMPFLITRSEFSDWFHKQNPQCIYCGLVDLQLDDKPFGKSYTPMFFSIDRLNSHLPYTLENIGLACLRCNRLKNDFFTHDEFVEIAQKYIRPRWMKKVELIYAH